MPGKFPVEKEGDEHYFYGLSGKRICAMLLSRMGIFGKKFYITRLPDKS
jgi:hypothetical protein